MTTEQFNKRSCEIIEKIQDLETEKILLEYALEGLRAEYIKQRKKEEAIVAENFKKFAENHNKRLAVKCNGN